MNKVILKGRLTKNPLTSFTNGENPVMVARFTVACDDRERGRCEDGNYPTNYVPCLAIGKVAEIAGKNLVKGKEVLLSGKMQSGSFENREGRKVYTLECFIKEIEFCGKKDDSCRYDNSFIVIPDGDDELPFV